jgi:acetyltransferase
VAHERLTRICFVDYDREMVLVAEGSRPDTGDHEILGVGRLSKIRGTGDAEFAILISDHFQRQGLGAALLSRLLQIGRDEKITRIFGIILPENVAMKRICEKLRFRLEHRLGDSEIHAEINL